MKGELRKETGLMSVKFHKVCPYCDIEMVLLEASRWEINICLNCGLAEHIGYGPLSLRELNEYREQGGLRPYTKSQYNKVRC